MSVAIKAPCPSCGDVEFGPEVVRLRPCRDLRQSYFAFRCPDCSDDVYRRAPVEVVHLLTQGGVVAVEWEVPDELLEGPHPGPPICLDDLIDLHTAIAAHDAGATASDRAQPVAPVTSSAIERLTAAFRQCWPSRDLHPRTTTAAPCARDGRRRTSARHHDRRPSMATHDPRPSLGRPPTDRRAPRRRPSPGTPARAQRRPPPRPVRAPDADAARRVPVEVRAQGDHRLSAPGSDRQYDARRDLVRRSGMPTGCRHGCAWRSSPTSPSWPRPAPRSGADWALDSISTVTRKGSRRQHLQADRAGAAQEVGRQARSADDVSAGR